MLKISEKLPQLSTPSWQSEIFNNGVLPTNLPLLSILENSCFYPASEFDIDPIVLTAGNIFSFVYCDYSISQKDFLELFLNRISGYSLIGARFINKEEIVPDSWMPEMPTEFDEWNGYNRLQEAQKRCEPFGHWSVWEKASKDKEQGAIISLLFLAGEGVACYQGLYLRNQISPQILAIIQPGHSLGGNWTNFFNPDAPFWKTVKKGVLPDKLLLGECVQKNLSFFERYFYYAPYRCPFGDDYLSIETVSNSQNMWVNKEIGLFELDKRTQEQKEQDRLELEENRKQEEEKRKQEEEKRKYEEIERQHLQRVWFEQYKKIRLQFKKAPALTIKLSHEEELEKQLFDKYVNNIRTSHNMFGALRRRDAIAISALMKRGADIHYKNNDGLSIVEYAQQLGLENLFNK